MGGWFPGLQRDRVPRCFSRSTSSLSPPSLYKGHLRLRDPPTPTTQGALPVNHALAPEFTPHPVRPSSLHPLCPSALLVIFQLHQESPPSEPLPVSPPLWVSSSKALSDTIISFRLAGQPCTPLLGLATTYKLLAGQVSVL